MRTPAEGGFALIQGQCPNCGASVAMNQHAKCPHCQALLRNGSHDWVLAEITQESEWDPQSTGTLPGQIVLRRRDEGLNVQSIEDFASVAFFRRLEAERTASVKPLRKLATQAFCEALAPTLGKSFRARCGVGSVDVAGFVSGNETEQAVVIITWSGTEFRIERPEVFREGGETGVRSEVFVLSREATARTDPDQAVSSAHCPNCGGPRTDNVSASCDFCGCVLNDGRLGWVLDAIHAVSSPAAQQLLQRCRAQVTAGPPPLPPMPSMRGPALIGWLVQTVYADGRLDPDEEAMLRQAAQRWEVAPATLEGVLSAARSGSLQVATPMDANEARAWLETMIEAAFANGTLDRSEIAVLQRLAATQGMDDKALGGLITSARSRLLKQARQDVRAAKAAGMPPLPKS